jgi:hypothetical protein
VIDVDCWVSAKNEIVPSLPISGAENVLIRSVWLVPGTTSPVRALIWYDPNPTVVPLNIKRLAANSNRRAEQTVCFIHNLQGDTVNSA